MTTERGVALVLAILVTGFLSAIGLGLALIVIMDRLAAGNLRGSVGLLYVADAALELAVRDLAHLEDWNPALTGTARSTLVDGEPFGVRDIPGGGTIDLTSSTNQLNCARATACSPVQMAANTRERPWGPNNADWHLYAHAPADHIADLARPVPGYLAVWIADDGREEDANPLSDAADTEAPGHGVLRIRAEARGPFGLRRVIEAELARLCIDVSDPCRHGIRVQSWREVRESVP